MSATLKSMSTQTLRDFIRGANRLHDKRLAWGSLFDRWGLENPCMCMTGVVAAQRKFRGKVTLKRLEKFFDEKSGYSIVKDHQSCIQLNDKLYKETQEARFKRVYAVAIAELKKRKAA